MIPVPDLRQVQIPVVRQTVLLPGHCNFTIEGVRGPDGREQILLHFDQRLGDVGDRLSIAFDFGGWENFKKAVVAAGSGVELPSQL